MKKLPLIFVGFFWVLPYLGETVNAYDGAPVIPSESPERASEDSNGLPTRAVHASVLAGETSSYNKTLTQKGNLYHSYVGYAPPEPVGDGVVRISGNFLASGGVDYDFVVPSPDYVSYSSVHIRFERKQSVYLGGRIIISAYNADTEMYDLILECYGNEPNWTWSSSQYITPSTYVQPKDMYGLVSLRIQTSCPSGSALAEIRNVEVDVDFTLNHPAADYYHMAAVASLSCSRFAEGVLEYDLWTDPNSPSGTLEAFRRWHSWVASLCQDLADFVGPSPPPPLDYASLASNLLETINTVSQLDWFASSMWWPLIKSWVEENLPYPTYWDAQDPTKRGFSERLLELESDFGDLAASFVTPGQDPRSAAENIRKKISGSGVWMLELNGGQDEKPIRGWACTWKEVWRSVTTRTGISPDLNDFAVSASKWGADLVDSCDKWNQTLQEIFPTLSWTGETNYEADGLHPEKGDSTTNFTFKIKYTDLDNDSPKSGYPKVHILKAGSEISGSSFTMLEVDAGDSDYADGKLYTLTTSGLASGTDYTYYFEAYDSHDVKASGEPTNSKSGPEVNRRPDTPSNISPPNGGFGISLTPTLQCSDFSDPDSGDTHQASQWQIRLTSGSYSSPVWDSGEDTTNLISITVPPGTLDYSTRYYWRVKHQDNHSAWSDWSAETSFATALPPVIDTPTFSPDGGTFTSPVDVTISCATPDATIHYTTDGSIPTESDQPVASGDTVLVDHSLTLKAKAWKAGWNPSGVKSADYTITGTVATPTFSPDGGTHTNPVDVTVDCATPGATIHYTTNGVTPTESDLEVAPGSTVLVDHSLTLKAKAWKAGWNPSGVKSADYIITSTVEMPTFSPDGGTHTSSVDVTISCATPDATIHYTTDGSIPTESDQPVASGDTVLVDHSLTLKAKAWKAGWNPSGVKSADYTITGSVALTSPNGGETWYVGETYNITWSSVGLTGNVDIHYSTDGGATYPNHIATVPASNSSYTWTIPDVNSMHCRVWVQEEGGGVSDESDADFTIAPQVNVLYVDDDAPDDPGPSDPTVSDPFEDGSEIHPFDAIQEAIDVAQGGDTIIVLDGTYMGEVNNKVIDFHGKALKLRSKNGPDNCIISCCIDSAASHGHGFYFHSGESANSVLDGFSVRNRTATYGGGVYCSNSNPTIMNCRFSGNTAESGGGIYIHSGSPTLVNCTFSGNRAEVGGGMYIDHGSPTLTRCAFSGNHASTAGGGVFNFLDSNPALTNCTFAGNTAAALGGGMLTCYGTPTLTNCLFSENFAPRGGGMYNADSSGTLTNCTFSGNSAGDYGGGVYTSYLAPMLTNCTFSGNSAYDDGGGIYIYGLDATTVLSNCIFWGNSDSGGMDECAQIHNVGNTPDVNYCCVQGWTGTLDGVGNIGSDPCFAYPGYWDPNGTPEETSDDFWVNGDYHLKSQAGRWDPNSGTWVCDDVTSPCIDAGNPGYPLGDEPNDANNVRINMGAYGGTAEASKSPACWALLADLTNDHTVDFSDLGVFVQYWLDSGQCIPSDLNRNESIEFADFAILAKNWLHGNCPPLLDSIGNKAVNEGSLLTFSVHATDPDGDTITYLVQNRPSGATFVDQIFSWTPTYEQAGTYQVTFIASDGQTQDFETITITVHPSDTSPPIVTNCSPAADAIQVPLNTLIILRIVDTGTGVDANSVTIRVNNNIVYTGNTAQYSSTYGECHRTGTKADYTFTYQSEQNFDFDQLINVTVNAEDLARNLMVEHSYSFRTEMRSFGENKKVGSDNLNKGGPVTVRDSSGNIWVAWHAGVTGSRDIYIGKLAGGADNFDSSIQLTNDATDQCNAAIAVGSDDKLYVAWQDNRRGNWDIYILTSNDGVNWSTEIRITDSDANEINPAIIVDSSNNAYIVWEDDRHGNQDIYVATSSNGFATKVVSQITSETSDQVEPAIAADSDNTIYVVWTDTRNAGRNDIYGAASNNGPWTNIPVVTEEDGQSSPAIATEADGSILHLVWVDDRTTVGDDDIFYAKTTGGLSPLTGSSIIDDDSGAHQLSPVIITTGYTGNDLKVFACWRDERNADADLYFVEISSGSGTNVFVGDDGTNSDQSEPAIGIDGYGYPYIVWTDNRNTNTDIYYAGSTFVEPTALALENVSISSGATVGTEPAFISSIDDVSVVVPPGAYSCDIRITISKVKNPQKFNLERVSEPYEFGPSWIEFIEPVTITIPYEVSSSSDPASAYWYNLLTHTLSQQGITDVQTIVVSPTLHALGFKTTHFAQFFVGR